MAQREPDANRKPPADTADTPGGITPEQVEDRPNVGIVEPGDYPEPAGSELPGPNDYSQR